MVFAYQGLEVVTLPVSLRVLCSIATVPLGTLPPASALTSMAQVSGWAGQATNAVQSLATLPALVTATSDASVSQSATLSKPGSAMVLSSALPPITAKLVTNYLWTVSGYWRTTCLSAINLSHFPLTSTQPAGDRFPTDVDVVLPGVCSSQDDRREHQQSPDIRLPGCQRGRAPQWSRLAGI